MNIDFIEAHTFTDKDNIFFGNLKVVSVYPDTYTKRYRIDGCNQVMFIYNESSKKFSFAGSVMYFVQGHNFTYKKDLMVEGINYLSRMIHFDLWKMKVDVVECGVIFEVDAKPKEYICHHRETKGMKLYENPKDKGNFRSFNDGYAQRKMYDAGKNILHKQGLRMKEIIQESGWNPQKYYLKWEVHYLKPSRLNNGCCLYLSDLVNPECESRMSEDVYLQYKMIEPMKSIIRPTEKKNLYALDIVVIELVEKLMAEGHKIEEIKKILYDRVNSSPVLTKSDKDARKKQLKVTFDKLKVSEVSGWDLSERIGSAL
jgi:hypothetical protein